MRGYCSACLKMREIKRITTRKLLNEKYIHEGICSKKGCNGSITRVVEDNEMLLDESGHKSPNEVYYKRGRTPKRIGNKAFGQRVFRGKSMVHLKRKDDKIIRVSDVKRRVRNEKT